MAYGRPRDSQRSKVYAWERKAGIIKDAEHTRFRAVQNREGLYRARPERVMHAGALTLPQCRALVARILRDHGFNVEKNPPYIGDGRRSRSAHAGAYFMALPRWARSVEVVCHETAHMMMAKTRNGAGYAAHGPEFVRLYINLLARYGKYGRRELTASAKAHGVKVVRSYPGGVW